MKKLMIAAAAALAGLAVNAASVAWTIDEAYTDGQWTLAGSGYYAYFMVDTGSLTSDAYSTYSIAQAQAAFADPSAVDISFLDKAIGSPTAFNSGTMAGTTPDAFTEGQDVTWYLVLADAATPGTATKAFLLTETDDGTPLITTIESSGGSETFQVGYLEQTGTTWATVGTAAPEPTSGLLLLLGVAGLALRRRRA